MTRDLKLVFAALVFWGVGEGLFIYVQPLYLEQLGADPVQIGAVLGLAAAAMMVAHIPAGALADLIGRRRLMVASWLLGTLTALGMFLATDLRGFALSMIGYHFTGFVLAPLNSYVTAARGRWSTTRALTMTTATFSAGLMVGSTSGGLIGEAVGLGNVFGVAAILFLLSSLIVLGTRPQPVEPARAGGRYRALLRNRAFARFLILTTVAFFAMELAWPLTPNYLQTVRGVSLSRIGLFGSANALGLVVLSALLGRLESRRGFLLAQGLVGLSVVLLWLGTGAPAFLLGYFLASGFRVAHSLAVAQAEGLVERAQMGLAYGVLEALISLVVVVGPPVAGLLYARDPALPYPVGLGLILASLALTSRLTPAPTPAPAGAEPAAHVEALRLRRE